MEQHPYATELEQICTGHGITITKLTVATGSFDKRISLINNAHVLRVSERPMDAEQAKFRRIAGLPHVPQLQQVILGAWTACFATSR